MMLHEKPVVMPGQCSTEKIHVIFQPKSTFAVFQCGICGLFSQLMKSMSSTDTPLGTVTLLQEKQKAEKTPYIVLSGGGKGIASASYVLILVKHKKPIASDSVAVVVEYFALAF